MPCELELHRVQLTIQSHDIDYEHIDDYIDTDLRHTLRDTKLKAHTPKLDQATQDLVEHADEF